MPTVPRYVQTETPKGYRQGGVTGQGSQALANAYDKLGNALGNAGDTLGKIAMTELDKMNKAVCEEAQSAYEDLMQVHKQSQEERKGKNALGDDQGDKGVFDSTAQYHKETVASLLQGKNEKQRLYLQNYFDQRGRQFGDWAFEYEKGQRNVYEKGQADAFQTSQINRAINNPGELKAAMANMEMSIREYNASQGVSKEETDLQVQAGWDKAVLGSAKSMAASGDLDGAMALVRTHGKDISPAVAAEVQKVVLDGALVQIDALGAAGDLAGMRAVTERFSGGSSGHGGYSDLKLNEKNNNPGNIEAGRYGKPGIGGRYAGYNSTLEGFQALNKLLQDRYDGMTPLKLAQTYAPKSAKDPGNDPQKYGASIAKKLGVSIDTPLNMKDPKVRDVVMREIAVLEGPVHRMNLDEASYAAGTKPIPDGYQSRDIRTQSKDQTGAKGSAGVGSYGPESVFRLKAQAKYDAAVKRMETKLGEGTQEASKLAVFGDTSQLKSIAAGYRAAGFTEKADQYEAAAKTYDDMRDVRIWAKDAPLSRVRAHMVALEEALKPGESDSGERKTLQEYENASAQLKAVSEVYSVRAKAYKDDPAAAADSDGLSLLDDATKEELVSARLAKQRENGIAMPVALTKGEVEAIKMQWRNSSTLQKVDLLTGKDGVIAQYGKHALNVLAEIGISPHDQFIAEAVVEDPKLINNAKLIWETMQLKDSEVPTRILDDKVNIMYQSLLESDGVFSVLQKQLHTIPGSSQTRELALSMEHVAKRLLKEGKSPDEVLSIMGFGKTTLVDTDRAVFVPKGMDSDSVDDAIDNLNRSKVDASLPENVKGNVRSDEISRIIQQGVWMNAPDNNGFLLVNNITGRPEKNTDGSFVRISNDDLLGHQTAKLNDDGNHFSDSME